MRVTGTVAVVAALLSACSGATLSTASRSASCFNRASTSIAMATTTNQAAATLTAAQSSTSYSGAPCSAISSLLSSYSAANPEPTGLFGLPPSLALSCLQSVPLDNNRSSLFLDYIAPYLEFQSTLSYLKDPPTGYLLPGVDIFGGLSQIKRNLESGAYKNQWRFEVDLYTLVNILPHDFHLNLPMPLLNVFNFGTYISAVSISTDGLSTPQVYLKDDLDMSRMNSSAPEPSYIVSVNGIPVSDYLQYIAQTNSDFQDPDAIYNQLFYSIPFNQQNSGNIFSSGAYSFGFTNDTSVYKFADGKSRHLPNFAVASSNFTGVTDGPSLFTAVELPRTTTSTASETTSTSAMQTSTASPSSTTSILGYPTPIAMQPEGYTAGYFLEDGVTAVLVMTAFESSDESEDGNVNQQTAIQHFLSECELNNKTKLIVDVSANGGGSVFNGYDAFKQLFPSLTPFGGSRFRSTPVVNFVGTVFTESDVYNETLSSDYQTQSEVDVNLHHFSNWNALGGPYLIHGDNFTAEMRYNLSDPIVESGNGIIVSGYLNNTDILPQVFASEDIVVLYDGSCGSTCTVFSQMMKSQGNVRSIAVGGRPQLGPMQGVGGSKGAQVYGYDVIQTIVGTYIPVAIEILQSRNETIPPLPPAEYIPSLDPFPLGNIAAKNYRFNLRNAYHDGDATQTPLQFVYEAANCRLFYKAEDIYDISFLWDRVANVAWGNGTCVAGSTVNSNNRISTVTGPYDTVPFSPAAMSNVTIPVSPGSLKSAQSSPNYQS
ncbi:hypothetical protein ACEPPN_006126 [Leptodophora sp. 'Broadleaf-Isolate-01']